MTTIELRKTCIALAVALGILSGLGGVLYVIHHSIERDRESHRLAAEQRRLALQQEEERQARLEEEQARKAEEQRLLKLEQEKQRLAAIKEQEKLLAEEQARQQEMQRLYERALALPPPTNETARTSLGIARVVSYDTDGLMMCVDGTYLPKMKITEIAEDDLRALLETAKMYELLTSYRYGQTRTAESQAIEGKLTGSWKAAGSLQDKVYLRLQALHLIRLYSEAAAAAKGSAAASGSSRGYANAIGDAVSDNLTYTAVMENQYNSAWNDNMMKAAQLEKAHSQNAAAHAQQAENKAVACALYSVALKATADIEPRPLMQFPPLTVRTDVNEERLRTANP